MDDGKELLVMIGALVAFILAIFILCSPIIYMEGRAKQKLLHAQGIEMTWYEAEFINVNAVNANVTNKK